MCRDIINWHFFLLDVRAIHVNVRVSYVIKSVVRWHRYFDTVLHTISLLTETQDDKPQT